VNPTRVNVQTKILLLLIAIVATLVGGLAGLKVTEQRRFREIAQNRAAERNRKFDAFLKERGDNLNVLVEDSSTWNDMVRAIVKDDVTWAGQNLSDETLATYQINAVWIYKPDLSLFYSRNNRYADNLRELPLPPDAFATLFRKERVCHFFLRVPQGWMEIRGGTVHPSIDRQRETTPQGYLFAGQIWIDDNIRRMSLFTGFDIRIVPAQEIAAPTPSTEERGLITFSRLLPGWNGEPIAQIMVQNDSPIIRELNQASERLFLYLLGFAAALFLIVSVSLTAWVRRPLHLITKSLKEKNLEALAPLQKRRHEFGRLAELIVKSQRTEEALQRTEDQLRHSQKLEAVGRLAGGIAHDFNNLLTAIIGYSELLESQLSGEDRDYALQIRKAGEQAASLTRQLLAFSRKQLLQPKVLDLNALILDMEKLLQRVIGEHIRIQIETSPGQARVCADPHQLEQVVLNLGVNARDAMPGGGKLTISTGHVQLGTMLNPATDTEVAPGDYILLTVCDTGSGMDAETKEQIFEPFFTTKGPGKGTGLGLATVYGIVKQSGGGISVDSQAGHGSTFHIFLPRVEAPLEPQKPAALLCGPGDRTETILVIEDEEVVRVLLCAVLKDAGYEVLCAGSPHDALRLAKAHSGLIHLLVTDVVMPEMHGPVVARLLSALQPAMKILFVSGYSENDISDQGVLDPGLEVLQKPFTHQSLVRKVREILASNEELAAGGQV
jgi:signal transduction histidine kinase/ActR/RegA family two-component response regulator